MVQIKDIVPVQMTDRTPSTGGKPQIAARIKLKDAEVIFLMVLIGALCTSSYRS